MNYFPGASYRWLDACKVCGIVPRQMWLFRGTQFWFPICGERHVCISCHGWARMIIKGTI